MRGEQERCEENRKGVGRTGEVWGKQERCEENRRGVGRTGEVVGRTRDGVGEKERRRAEEKFIFTSWSLV